MNESNASAILRAACREMVKFGVGGLRVDAVAAGAQLNKRMIYHYFGDKQGLVEAVYRFHSGRLLATTNGLQDATRQVLSHLIGSLPQPASELPLAKDESVGTRALVEAIEIMLPVLMQRAKSEVAPGEITAEQWRIFALEVASLAFDSVAHEIFGTIPGEGGFENVSDRLLTQSKPRYRLASTTRTIG